MEMLRLSAIAVAAAIGALFLKQTKSPFALTVSLAAAAVLYLFSVPYFGDIRDVFFSLAEKAGIAADHIRLLFRVILTAFLAECAAALCRDAGESVLALSVEIAGKLVILGLCAPLAGQFFGLIANIVP